jgi:alkaline phosphatase
MFDIYSVGSPGNGSDGLPYSTITYANGPGYKRPESDGSRHDISKDDMRKYM